MENNNLFEVDKAEAAGQSLNLRDMLSKYLNYWWLFVLAFGLSFVGAWLYLRYTTPKFKVEATLMVRSDNSKSSAGSDAMLSSMLMMQSSANKQNEMQMLRSRAMLMRVVKKLGLTKQYFAEGKVKKANIYNEAPFSLDILQLNDTAVSFSWRFQFESGNDFRINEREEKYSLNQPFENSYGKFVLRPQVSPYKLTDYAFVVNYLPEYAAAIQLSSGLSVNAAKDNSNLITLEYITDNTLLGSDVLNTLMDEYNSAAVEDKNETNQRVVDFLEDRLQLMETQLDSVELALMRYRKSHEIIDAAVQSELYFESMGGMEQRIREQEIQLRVVDILKDYIETPANRSSLVPSTIGLTDQTLLSMVASYNELIVTRQRELLTGATKENVIVRNIDRSIEDTRLKILRSLNNIRDSYKGALSTLETQNKTIRNQISSIPEKEKGSRDIARQQEIKQSLYLYILQKKEESSIALASTIPNALILDKALNIKTQISPRTSVVYGIALMLAFMVPIVSIFIIDLFNDRVTTRTDITKVTQAPIIGEIGHNKEKETLVFAERDRSVIAEQIRILRTNLRFQLGDKFENPVILITSSFSGEGKSFVSTNLAAAQAITGKKTAVLEFDLRKPKIMSGLGLHSSKGVTTYLVGGAALEDLPVKVNDVSNLYVIPCGPVPPNPAELLLSDKIKDLFLWLKKEFDVVIIDTAPVGLVSDSVILSQYADMTLYVIRQRYTFKRQLNMIDELYRQRKLPKMGLLVNDVVADGAKGYYGYGAGAYGYGYGYGYGEKKKKKYNRS